MMGCGFPDGEQGYNIGRNAQLLAGIDHHVPAVTVSRFCASSLQTIRMAFHAIKAGEGDQYIAAGVECVSRGAAMTFPLMNPRIDGTNGTGYNVYISMGITAENVAERCKVSRESQDEWAALSQQRALAARDSGHFDREIVGVDIPEVHDAGGDVVAAHTVTRDDGPRPGTTVEKLAQLKPAFKPDGTVTAGNACPLNDGAAAVLVMSEEKARELGLEPRARIVASSVAAIRPEIMGLGPIPAIRAVLKAAGMTIEDMDAVEMNEAFAAQVVPCRDELGIDPEKLNINGGAIALGHPFGMTGARIMTTLLNNLDAVDGTLRARDDVRRRRDGTGDDRRAAQLANGRDGTMATTRLQPSDRRARQGAHGTGRTGHGRDPRDRRGDLPQPRRGGRGGRGRLLLEPRASRRAAPGDRGRRRHAVAASGQRRRLGGLPARRHEVIDEHGRLDILVNNAGVTVDKPIWKMSVDDWHKVLRVNLSGSFYMTKPAIAHMIERGSGRIINISSVTGEIGNIGQANYTASKSGLFGLTKTLAREAALALRSSGKLENGIGVTVNCVTPGLIETDMVATIPPFMVAEILEKIPMHQQYVVGIEAARQQNQIAETRS